MTFSVWKFELKIEDEFFLEMPREARLLRIGEQLDKLVLWAVVRVDAPKVRRWFRLMGTGHPDTGRILAIPYVDSVQLSNGLVFHLFDCGEGGHPLVWREES